MKVPMLTTIILCAMFTGCRTTAIDSSLNSAAESAGIEAKCQNYAGVVISLGRCTSQSQCDEAYNNKTIAAELKQEKFCKIERAYIRLDTFQQALHGNGGLAIDKYLARNRFEPNSHINQPADFYCTTPEVGGSLALYHSPDASGAMCEFADDSNIGDWTIYYGSGSDAPAGYQKFISIIKQAHGQ